MRRIFDLHGGESENNERPQSAFSIKLGRRRLARIRRLVGMKAGLVKFVHVDMPVDTRNRKRHRHRYAKPFCGFRGMSLK